MLVDKVKHLLNTEAVRTIYVAIIAIFVALNAVGVLDQDVIDQAIQIGIILGLGETARAKVYSRDTAERIEKLRK